MTLRVTDRYPVSELRRTPKEGDECVCGTLFEEDRWWSHYLNRGHDGQHKPWKFGTHQQCVDAEKKREAQGE